MSDVLSEFARTLITDFPIQAILDRLVERIVDILPITAAGVTLISDETKPRYVAASNASALRYERLQSDLGQGPCVLAYETAEAVMVPDLTLDERFPVFTPAAAEAGLGAVFTFPLRHGDQQLGALDLYRATSGSLSDTDARAAQTLADVAAAYLLNAQAREEARATSDRHHHHALHDPLTGLANRRLLQERIEHAAQRAQRSHQHAAVLLVDLDGFKAINDTYGHGAGDELLIAIAQRLAAVIRPGDTLCRLGGDEFVILCEDLSGPADVEALAARIDEAFAQPFPLVLAEVVISGSVGMAFAGLAEEITDELIGAADLAMYRAKSQSTRGLGVVDLRKSLSVPAPNPLGGELRRALADGELELAYLPIVRSVDGHVTGMEALLRWIHPERGLIPAVTLVEVAEESDLIVDVGAWVLGEACQDLRRWREHRPDVRLDLGVNVSGRQLMNPHFASKVATVLTATGMDPYDLVLEMKEDVLNDDRARAFSVLSGLRDLGVRLALDDFGTGYSSLSHLRELPICLVKIDQSLVAKAGNASAERVIVSAIVELARTVDMAVLAEGVETSVEAEQVAAIGCELAQGYYYARPMPAREVVAFLDSWPRRLPVMSPVSAVAPAGTP